MIALQLIIDGKVERTVSTDEIPKVKSLLLLDKKFYIVDSLYWIIFEDHYLRMNCELHPTGSSVLDD